jgi:hypothetical protein
VTFTPLDDQAMKKWNRWLSSSHNIAELPGHLVYQYGSKSSLYLTALTRLPGFEMRQERDVEAIIVTFEIMPGIRTIANVWGDQVFDLRQIRRPGDLGKAKQRVLDAAREGRLWWGTERLLGFPDLTSICYIFARDEWFPGSTKKKLYADQTLSQLETPLNLV